MLRLLLNFPSAHPPPSRSQEKLTVSIDRFRVALLAAPRKIAWITTSWTYTLKPNPISHTSAEPGQWELVYRVVDPRT